MTRSEYIERLRRKLAYLPAAKVQEILYDYEEHFEVGVEMGKTEEEIAIDLGLPETVGSQYRFERAMEDANQNRRPFSLLRAILTAISLGFFNMFFVLGLYIGLIAVVFALFGAGVGVGIGGLALTFAGFVGEIPGFVKIPFILDAGSLASRVFLIGNGVGCMALGALLVLGYYNFSFWVYGWTYRYVRGNIELIRKAGE